MNYLNKVQLTVDDLLNALPYKLRKGFYKEGDMNLNHLKHLDRLELIDHRQRWVNDRDGAIHKRQKLKEWIKELNEHIAETDKILKQKVEVK